MLLQISSGQGPVECELAVRLLFESLRCEFCSTEDGFEILSVNRSRWCDGYASIIFRTAADLSFLQGSVEWQCKSFLRPGHKRRNWFVDVAVLPDAEEESVDGRIQWQFFRCGGNGGQNVNKVETGVRLIHPGTGISVTCTEERSQYMNRRRALEKLRGLLAQKKAAGDDAARTALWRRHKKLVRGQAVRIYAGPEFTLREPDGKTMISAVQKECCP